ncbi:MAG: ABC transporter substrate-binding protein [Treponema sp.]|jgi:peptide/nickel transport system substrate-binding protein|nr:ABC transporter substrate-binding protein [Treponema sp.]
MKTRFFPRIAAPLPAAQAIFLTAAVFAALMVSCSREEVSLEEYNAAAAAGLPALLAKTEFKPYRGEDFVPGRRGGTWTSVITSDPKSFNHLIAEKDSATSSIVSSLTDYLIDYNPLTREWEPRAAAAEVKVYGEAGKLDVIYTLRDDLYWSYYNANRRVKVTSDDVVFWYNEISGDPECQSSGYYQQFLTLEDGSEGRVTIEKLDDRRFVFHFPRIVADPILATNMDFGPRHVYEPAKRSGGVEAVLNLYGVQTDPQTIPSMGKWFLTEYTAGQRLVFKRNGDYWRKDAQGLSIPYCDEEIIRIIPEENTQFLLFKNGESDSYVPRPEDLDELVTKENPEYAVFNAEGSLGAAFWTFNQNPQWKETPKYRWFTTREFRQAMSCLLNRDRIIAQVYRGLAEPKLDFFPEPNPFHNPAITNGYLYDPNRAMALLESAGFKLRGGRLLDIKENPVEFDLVIRSESAVNNDIASIIMDELSKAGIKVNIRVVDFQKMVEALFTTFEWDSMLMGFGGANIFPSQGSNVWPSSGNLHAWYPNQPSPATDWEARVDYLYNEGCYTIDKAKAKAIWDEFQSIIIEQCPIISLFRTRGFFALRRRWDFSNVYFDNLQGAELNYVFLAERGAP